MGFTTGFLGGITLTYSVIYLSVYIHRSNRTYQSLLLRQQIRLLNSKIDPPEPEYELPPYRLERAGLEEQFKDGWNRSVASLVNYVQDTDWEATRIRLETQIGNAWSKVKESDQVQELQQKVQEGVIGTEKATETAKNKAADPLQGKRLLDEK